MKFIGFMYFAVASLMLFTSCGNDNTPDIKMPGTGESYMAVKLVNASGTRNSAREDGTPDECYIGELEFFVFNSDGARDTRLGYQVFDHTQSEYSFMVEPGNDKTILVTANMRLGELFEADGTTPARLTTVRKAIYDQEISEPLKVPGKGIPMSGELIGLAVQDGDVKAAEIVVNRLFAKFDAPAVSDRITVELNTVDEAEVKKLLGNDIHGNIAFDLTGYVVVNGLKRSMAFSSYSSDAEGWWNTGEWLIGDDYTNYTHSIYNNGYPGKVYSGGNFSGQDRDGVYLYENSPRRVEGSVADYDARSVYAMIVQGDLYDDAHPLNRITRYWRINVSNSAATENVYQILRNAIYSVELRKVKTPGYANPEDAEKEKTLISDNDEAAIDVYVEIAQWKIFDER